LFIMMMMMMMMMMLAMVVPSLSSPSFLVRSAWNWMNSNFFSQLDTAGTVTMIVMKKSDSDCDNSCACKVGVVMICNM
jgi:hypothetical protein